MVTKQEDENGLNGFILLSHVGTDPRRKEKFYDELPALIRVLKSKGYQFVRIDELLAPSPTANRGKQKNITFAVGTAYATLGSRVLG